jgi:hypothetical protein
MDDKKQTRDTKQSDYDYIMSIIEKFTGGKRDSKKV